MAGILFASLIGFPQNAWAACLNSYQTQTIAAAYNGDETPTVNTIEACGGDDVSYQIPIATTINFDGVQYDSVFATTNSVITFGQADNTYWDYPQTPSISLYSMDWVIYPTSAYGWGRSDESMIINYSEGGFQISMNLRPIWLQSQPEPVNIVINAAITNTGGLAISYSTAFPTTGVAENYAGLRTGVRLHNGQVVSLQSAGFYEVADPSSLELSSDPVDSSYVPGQPSITPEQEQVIIVQATQLAAEISDLNNLISEINQEPILIPDPEPTTEPEPDPQPEINEPEPDVVVEPEIIDPEDPRFPDGTDEQNEQDPSTKPEDSETIEEPSENEEPLTEPESPEEDTNGSPISEPENPQPVVDPSETLDNIPQIDNSIINSSGLTEEELNMLKEQLDKNAALRMAVEQFGERAAENQDAPMPYTLADATTEVQAEEFIKAVSIENVTALLSNPTEALGAAVENVTELLSNFGELGSDMTDDQREKAQEVIVPVIIASQIAGAVTRRLK